MTPEITLAIPGPDSSPSLGPYAAAVNAISVDIGYFSSEGFVDVSTWPWEQWDQLVKLVTEVRHLVHPPVVPSGPVPRTPLKFQDGNT